MIELDGKYGKAKVFTNNIDSKAISQIIEILNEDFTKDSSIRIMPDCHPGAGCVIGTTMVIKDKVVPNLVGVDLSCGVLTVDLKDIDIDFKALDKHIRENVPFSYHTHEDEQDFDGLENLVAYKHINKSRALKSVGTLGGGNHYVEVGEDSTGNKYLTIHTGSRYLGKQLAEHYQDLAYKRITENYKEVGEMIKRLKSEGREKEIQGKIDEMKPKKIRKELAYLEGENLFDYLYDTKIANDYAKANRQAIAKSITDFLGIKYPESFDTVHNYIDVENRILRKGAISAQKGEKVLIPINMRDGAILARGKGNPDWNYSAPHGSGRLFSRSKAKETISLEQFKESMEGIYSSSVREDTIDESAFAYKSMDEIIENTKDTIEIIDIIKPLYNFKA